MFINIHIKDQLKALVIGLANICLNFNKYAKEILRFKEANSLSRDWNMIAQDMNIAMLKYGRIQSAESQKK